MHAAPCVFHLHHEQSTEFSARISVQTSTCVSRTLEAFEFGDHLSFPFLALVELPNLYRIGG